MLDARIAQVAVAYPWGFQWLAGYMVNKNHDRRYRIEELSNSKLQQIAQNDLAGLQTTRLKADQHALEPIEELCDKMWGNKGIPTCNGTVMLEREFTHGCENDQDMCDWLHKCHSQQFAEVALNKIKKYYYVEISLMTRLLLKRNKTLQNHVRSSYETSSAVPSFSKKIVGIDSDTLAHPQQHSKPVQQAAMSEFKYVAKLQQDNPVNKNSKTNKFAELFDRIA